MDKLLSLCMIVKDEEHVLDRCLSSVQGLADEIIVVDTGSVDRTKDIASKYTSQIYDYQWNSHFGEARNAALKHATGRWILVLDADEYVQAEGHDQLRDFLQSIPIDKPCGFNLRILNLNGSGDNDSDFNESSGARLFANNQSIHYVEPIHEQLVSHNGALLIDDYPFIIFHTGYTASEVEKKQKATRNLNILERMNTNGKRNDPYFCFVLGNEYANSKREDDALEAYRRSWSKSKESDPWYSYLLDHLATLTLRRGDYKTAYTVIQQGISVWPNHTDFHCFQGILLEQLGLWKEAESEFNKCITLADTAEGKQQRYCLIHSTYGKIVPLQMLAEIRWRKGDTAGAIHHWVKALQIQPQNFTVFSRLWEVLMPVSSDEQIGNIVEQLYPVDNPLNAAILLQIALNLGHAPLALRYTQILSNHNLPLVESEYALRRLLFRDWTPESTATFSKMTVSDSIAIATAIVLRQPRLALSAVNKTADYSQLIEQILSTIDGHEHDGELLQLHEETLEKVLQLLWRFQYHDIYFALLQRYPNNTNLLNRLGDWFYSIGRLDQAFELYTILLENGILNGVGCLNVGLWNLNNGNKQEAAPFLEAAFEQTNDASILGIFKETFSEMEYFAFRKKHFEHLHHVPQELL